MEGRDIVDVDSVFSGHVRMVKIISCQNLSRKQVLWGSNGVEITAGQGNVYCQLEQ